MFVEASREGPKPSLESLNERERKALENVRGIVNAAVRRDGKPELIQHWERNQDAILATLKVNLDGSVVILQGHILQMHQSELEAFKNESQEMENIQKRLASTFDALGDAQKTLKSFNNDELIKSEISEYETLNIDVAKQKRFAQHAVEARHILEQVSLGLLDRGKATSALNEITAFLKEAGFTDGELEKIRAKDAQTLNEAYARLMLVASGKVKIDGSELNPSIEAVEKDIHSIAGSLAKISKKIDAHMLKRFDDRYRYNYRLGGGDAETTFRMSLREDGSLDVTYLDELVKTLEKNHPGLKIDFLLTAGKLDAEKLIAQNCIQFDSTLLQQAKQQFFKEDTSDDDFKAIVAKILAEGQTVIDDKNFSDQARGALLSALNLEELLTKIGIADMHNGAGISLQSYIFRSRLPGPIAEKLNKAGAKTSLGTLFTLANKAVLKIEKKTEGGKEKEAVSMDLTKLEDLVFDGEPDVHGNRRVNTDRLREIVATLHLFAERTTPYPGLPGKVSEWDHVLKYADRFIADKKEKKIFSHKGDDFYFARPGTIFTGFEETNGMRNLLSEVQKNCTTTARWNEALLMYSNQAFADAMYIGSSWTEWVEQMPRIVYDPKGDGALANLVQQKSKLAKAEAALRSFRTNLHGVNTEIDAAFTNVDQLHAKQRKALGAPNPAKDNDIESTAMQGLTVVEASLSSEKKIQSINSDYGSLPPELHALCIELPLLYGQPGHELAKRLSKEYLKALPAGRPDFAEFLKTHLRKDDVITPADADAIWKRATDVKLEHKEYQLDVLQKYGLKLVPNPLLRLQGIDGERELGKWLSHPDKACEGLTAVLEEPNPAKAAIIAAFRKREDATYTNSLTGNPETITVAEAKIVVEKLQSHLLNMAKQPELAKDQLEKRERYPDPIDKGLRTTLKTITKLWNGDFVDKAKVLIGLGVTAWAVYTIWQRAKEKDAPGWIKAAKGAIIATPLLLVGDAIYKKQTGRSFLGQVLRYDSKEQRESALEQFKRLGEGQGAEYAFLVREDGHAALRVLLEQRDSESGRKLTVKELMKWRSKIRSVGGYNTYEETAPKIVKDNLYAVRSKNKAISNNEEAARQYYLAFESLLISVAHLHGISGTKNEMIEEGERIVNKRYVNSPDNEESELLDMMFSEMQSPDVGNRMLSSRSIMEKIADGAQGGTAAGIAFFERQYFRGELMAKKAGKVIPEYFEAGKEYALQSADDLWKWAQVTGLKLWYEGSEDTEAAVKFLAATFKEAGIVIVTDGPKIVRFAFDTVLAVGRKSKDVLQKVYVSLLNLGVTGQVLQKFNEFLEVETEYSPEDLLQDFESVSHDAEVKEDFEKESIEERESVKHLLKQMNGVLKTHMTMGELKALVIAAEEKVGSGTWRQKAAALEFLKRKMFSQLIAARVERVKNLAEGEVFDGTLLIEMPKSLDDIAKEGLAKEIFDSYGQQIMTLVGSQPTTLLGNGAELLESKLGPEEPFTYILGSPIYGLDYVTRIDAKEYLWSLGVYEREMLSKFEEAKLKNDPSLKDVSEEQFQEYLRTITTNAALELTLQPATPDEKMPRLSLGIASAQELFDRLRKERAGSALFWEEKTPLKLQDFSVQAASDVLPGVYQNPNLMQRLQMVRPERTAEKEEAPPSSDVYQSLTPAESKNAHTLQQEAEALFNSKKGIDVQDPHKVIVDPKLRTIADRVNSIRSSSDKDLAVDALEKVLVQGLADLRDKVNEDLKDAKKREDFFKDGTRFNATLDALTAMYKATPDSKGEIANTILSMYEALRYRGDFPTYDLYKREMKARGINVEDFGESTFAKSGSTPYKRHFWGYWGGNNLRSISDGKYLDTIGVSGRIDALKTHLNLP